MTSFYSPTTKWFKYLKNMQFALLLSALILLCQSMSAQNDTGESSDSPHSVFLLGNMSSLPPENPTWNTLRKTIESQEGKKTVLYLGDFLDENGLEDEPQESETAKINQLITLGENADQYYYFPGDREWNNAQVGGLKKLKHLDRFLKKRIGEDLLISDDGCPGPVEIELADDLIMIAINSNWFVQPETDRPQEEDVKCDHFNEITFWEEVEGIIKDSDGKNVIIAAHHPVMSYGQYAGYRLLKTHFLPPVIGSYIAGYHQNVGSRTDLSRPPMAAFGNRIQSLLIRYPSVMTVSGHEYDLQIQGDEENFFINSGSVAKSKGTSKGEETLFKYSKNGFIQLQYHENGAIDIIAHAIQGGLSTNKIYEKRLVESACIPVENNKLFNQRIRSCVEELQINAAPFPPLERVSGTIYPNKDYYRNKFGQFFLGKHYRTTWAAPINDLLFLPIDTLRGGLTPYAQGGGGQTYNLKFKAADGTYFAFRSVDKNATRRKDQDLVSGIYGDIVRDLVSIQHPFGPSIAGYFMDELDIPHSKAKLYVMPDSPMLGNYQEAYKGMLGYLEINPKGKKDGRPGFMGADKVEGCLEVVQKLLEDNDHSVDEKAYAKGRVFDMWISDWDRHHDNIKWLGYGNKKEMVYTPFPKDRDKAFSKLQGVYSVMDLELVSKVTARFRKNYGGLKSLNKKGEDLDRFFCGTMVKEDWEAAANEVYTKMTDEVIANAMLEVPADARELTSDDVQSILISRREKLPKIIQKYYKILSKEIFVFGSDKDEIFEIERLENGDVHVQIFKRNRDKIVYDRICKKEETKEIRIYGLGGEDKFSITGSSKKSILVRIIPGKDEDKIVDESSVAGMSKKTKIYNNNEQEDLILGSEAVNIKTPEKVILETQNLFAHNYHTVIPLIAQNADDGFITSVTATYTKQKFNKPGFGAKYNLNLLATTEQQYDVGFSATYRHAVGKWDMNLSMNATNRDRTFPNFYGFGNATELNENLESVDYYRNQTVSANVKAGLIYRFPHQNDRSSLKLEAVYEQRDVMPDPDDDSTGSIYDQFDTGQGLGLVRLPGVRQSLNLDFRDSGSFPTKGTQFKLDNVSFLNSAQDNKLGGQIKTEASIFMSTHQLKMPFTLSLRAGSVHAYGKTPFYYKSYLGQVDNHRGFRRRRFGGDTAAYLNSELRWNIGTVRTSLVPLTFGVLGLYDVGRVWVDGENDPDKLHTAVGGGIYIVPYADSFNLNLTFAHSDEEDLLFSFAIGFFVR